MKNIDAKIKKTQSDCAVHAKLCFENLRGANYKKGYLITRNALAKEKQDSPLCELASFANVIVDECGINESNGAPFIYVSAIANSKDKLQRLYEWIEKYAGKDKIDAIAPGLLEALNPESVEKIDEDNSVAVRFAKYRKLYEEEELVSEDNENLDEEDEGNTSDNDSDKEDTDNEQDDKENQDEQDDKESQDDEQDELTAIVLEVKKGDEDKLKDELIEAGVDEDDIEIISEEEDDEQEEKNESEDNNEEKKDETVKVKIAVDSFDALNEYLEGKGFNLEEELGGEIVSDEEDDDKEEDEEDDENKDKEELDAEFDGFDDLFK